MSIELLLSKLARPAQRALQNAGITTFEQLAALSEEEILTLHGIGTHALQSIRETLQEHGLSFADKSDPSQK